MSLRRIIRKVLLEFELWRFRRRNPALAEAHRAEREAKAKRNTQAIHRARIAKMRATTDSLRSIAR